MLTRHFQEPRVKMAAVKEKLVEPFTLFYERVR